MSALTGVVSRVVSLTGVVSRVVALTGVVRAFVGPEPPPEPEPEATNDEAEVVTEQEAV